MLDATLPERIYNSHYGNGVLSLFTFLAGQHWEVKIAGIYLIVVRRTLPQKAKHSA